MKNFTYIKQIHQSNILNLKGQYWIINSTNKPYKNSKGLKKYIILVVLLSVANINIKEK